MAELSYHDRGCSVCRETVCHFLPSLTEVAKHGDAWRWRSTQDALGGCTAHVAFVLKMRIQGQLFDFQKNKKGGQAIGFSMEKHLHPHRSSEGIRLCCVGRIILSHQENHFDFF